MRKASNLTSIVLFLVHLGVTFSLQVHDGLRGTSKIRTLQENEAQNNDDAYNDMIVNQSQQDDLITAEAESGSGGNFFIDQVQSVKNTAESQAWDFYSHAPSEWTNAEWNAVFIIAAVCSLSCCILAGCFAYCCICTGNEEDEDDDEKSRFRRPRIVCKRRKVIVKGEESPRRENGDVKSHSTVSSGKSVESFEIEDDKQKPLLQQESMIKNISLVKSFEQVIMPKTKSRSQRSAAASAKTDPTHYSRMKV